MTTDDRAAAVPTEPGRRGSRILVTGAAGTLGRALLPRLVAAGYDVRASDVAATHGPSGVESMVLDVRDRDAVQRAMVGVAGVIHAAAWHGIHLADHPASDFWDLNATGTFNVLQAALDQGVRAVVLSSTMGVYGLSRRPQEGGPAVRIHEGLPVEPTDIYGVTKVVAEELSRAYARRGVAGIALRYGMFVPEPVDRAGIRYLYGGVDEEDVARANILALQRLFTGPADAHLGALNIESALPWEPDDGNLLRHDPLAVVGRYWPDGPALLAATGVGRLEAIDEYYDIRRAAEVLDWRPQRGFAEYVAELRTRAPSTTLRDGLPRRD